MNITNHESLVIHKSAWHYHRNTQARFVSLPAPLTARILGRKAHHNGLNTYTGDINTGHITCGLKLVWKTGARQVVKWVLAHTSEKDLATIDYVEQLIWLGHCRGRVRQGLPVISENAPTVYRDGRQLSPEEHRALLQQADRHGHLDAIEQEIAALASIQTEGGRNDANVETANT
jgi:hypothetical protein